MISYFHVGHHHPETAHWFRTLLAPLLGGLGMLYVVWLLWSDLGFAVGAADTTVFRLIPYLVVAVFALGAGVALYLKYRNPERHEIVGRLVLEDSYER